MIVPSPLTGQVLLKSLNTFLFKILFIVFRERRREREKEGEKHRCVVASRTPPTGDLAATQACALTGSPPKDLSLIHI